MSIIKKCNIRIKLIILLLSVFLSANLLISQSRFHMVKFVKVPNVIGKTKAEAIKILKKVGLNYAIGAYVKKNNRYSGMENRVVKQSPKQGSSIAKGSKVTMFIYNPFTQNIGHVTKIKIESKLSAFRITPDKANPGDSSTAEIEMSAPTGKNGEVIYITSFFSNVRAPARVTVPEGEKSVKFKIDVPASLASILDHDMEAKFKAWNKSVSRIATLMVLHVPKKCKLSSFSISPEERYPGGFVLGTIKMTAPAGKEAEKVLITSFNSDILVPKEIKIMPGKRSGGFKIDIPYSLASKLEKNITVKLKVSHEEISKEAYFTILLPPKKPELSSFSITPESTEPGKSVKGKLALSIPAEKNGATVLITSYFSDVQAPKEVVIPMGEKTATFMIPVSTALSLKLDRNKVVKFKAWYNGVSKEASFTIEMLTEVKNVDLSANRVITGNKVTADITLNRAAIGDGNKVNIFVTHNEDRRVRWSPSTLIIPKGEYKGSIEFSTFTPQEISKLFILNFQCNKINVAKTLVVQRYYIGLLGLFEKADLGGGEGFLRLDSSQTHNFKLYAKQNYPSPYGGIAYKIVKEGDHIDKIIIPNEISIRQDQKVGIFEVKTEAVLSAGKAYIYAISPDGKRYRCTLIFE